MPIRLAMVCEAEADFCVAARLAERVFVESIGWVEDELLLSCPIWVNSSRARPFWLWTEVRRLAEDYGIDVRGYFDGRPGEPDARAGGRALRVLKHIHRDQPIEGVVLVRDDDRETERRQGLEQARQQWQQSKMPERIVIGLAHCKRECWVLAGFDPTDESETLRLEEVRKDLGFDPRIRAQELTAKPDDAKRSAKRIVKKLLLDNHDRERQCLHQTDLETLRTRGTKTGLSDYLEEIRERLVPVFGLNGPEGA